MLWVHPTVCLSVSGGEKESLTESSSGSCDLCGLRRLARCRHAAQPGLGHGGGSLAAHQGKGWAEVRSDSATEELNNSA